ncbi:MAG: epoxyqueuosine reductase QueH [Lachnospiraceae bacterium]|nr:epoxyqueuosine reductase QueH [Lachnospiraceae bacterium]
MQTGQKVNYQKKTEEIIAKRQEAGEIPRLLLHSCCAPCSSYVLEYLSEYFEITVLYYNPNISPKTEYEARLAEQKRLIEELPVKHPVAFLAGIYEPEHFYRAAAGLEQCAEGGERCTVCYELRLREAAQAARRGGFDFFTTTLSISPLKDAEKLNTIGRALSEEYGVAYLYSDFKKKNGYKRSIELSAQYHLYRQDYCGCVFSKEERQKRQAEEGTV